MPRSVILVAVLCGASLPAAAQEGPSFACDRAEGAVEEAICADPDLAALDRRLADRFAAAREASAEVSPETADTLTAMQRGWIKGRNACWKAGDVRACTKQSYLRREAELVAGFGLEPPINRVTWTCAGRTPASVTTTFFATELPSVLIETGGETDVGTQTRTASGARYEGSFGKAIWTKGDTAVLTWPQGEDHDCVLAGPDG
ncbi:Protein of unknown function [Tranquillimonas rosea]|uniref:Membrane-bound lysozyme-inhibitor of c-type lysozyme n=1 Tax=Tranquillimonas rosea TaxID=641238 RepID=A0A1H9WTY0_9RHOB|nr:MliC family protein [Tranquillimonas rosea]SES37239.1 Protein of unknown function [Tranquillimonas rosea]